MKVSLRCLTVALIVCSSVAFAQSSVSTDETMKELRFPTRGIYRNPSRVVQQYDAFSDRTRLRLLIASSSNPVSIIVKPIVLLGFEAAYSGAEPNAAPDSILMTGRIFRLAVTRQQPGTIAQPALAQQSSVGASAAGPMLTFLVTPSADTNASSIPAWRTSVGSLFTGSDQLVAADDTGIWFHGRLWLAAIANVIDMTRKKGESPLTLLAHTDTGRFSLDHLPERVRKVLHDGLRVTITEETHRLSMPVSALVRMANAPQRVKSRFGTLDFTIEGDELNALQDFASRLGPKDGATVGPGAQLAVAPRTSPQPDGRQAVADSAGAVGAIPAGTEIELKSGARECTDSAKLGHQFTAKLARPIGSVGVAHLDAGAPVLLMVSDAGQGPQADTMQITAVSVTLLGKQYPLHGSIVKTTTMKGAQGTQGCVPVGGLLTLRLSRAFQMPR